LRLGWGSGVGFMCLELVSAACSIWLGWRWKEAGLVRVGGCGYIECL